MVLMRASSIVFGKIRVDSSHGRLTSWRYARAAVRTAVISLVASRGRTATLTATSCVEIPVLCVTCVDSCSLRLASVTLGNLVVISDVFAARCDFWLVWGLVMGLELLTVTA
jgi:hypothetical protein